MSLPARIGRPRLAAFVPSRGGLLAALAGALNTLAFAPFDFWPLAIASPMALYLLLRHLDPLAAFFRGLWYGIGFWLAGVSWVYVSIHTYGYTPVNVAVFLTVLFAVFLAVIFFAWWTALYGWLSRGVMRPLLFVALWVLAEWVRSWLFTGFPWLWQGYAFIDTPLAGFAPVGGALLVSALATGIAVLAIDVARGTRRARMVAGGAIGAMLLGGWGLQQVAWTTPVGEPLRVSLVQGNIPQDMKWLTEMQQPTLDIYAQQSSGEWDRDLIVWPESAIPAYLHEVQPLVEEVQAQARAHGNTLVTGIPYVEQRDGRLVYHNTVLGIDGDSVAMYHKVNLVPFGEFVPFAEAFRAIAPFFSLPMMPLDGFSPGADGQPPLRAGNTAMTPLVCYEVVYADYVRRNAVRGGMLLTVSNDAWFGGSHGPHQHFQMARMRALENGRWMARATNTGITAFIDPQGQVTGRIPQFERAVLRGRPSAMQGSTPFIVLGHWPLLAAAFAALALALRRRLARPS